MNAQEEKRRLRQTLRREMAAWPESYFRMAGKALCARLRALPEYREARTVFCFVGAAGEIDTRPFLAQAIQEGKRVCVPLCTGPGWMEARHITELAQLAPGAYGIPEPPSAAPLIAPWDIDLAVVPCLACDGQGRRLGKGGGYYDRFLAVYTGPSAALCPERALQRALPTESHDRPVTVVLTERETRRTDGARAKEVPT